MTGAQWASQDQTEFLYTFVSDYYKINKGDKNYVPFWTRLREEWFERYPEHNVSFPDRDIDDLLPLEQEQVTKDIQARIKQLKTWFRWRSNPRASTGGRRGRLDLEPFEERTRQLKDYEMYSKLFYDEKIKAIVEDVEDELGSVELSKGEKLNLRKRISKDLYEAEDDDVKELVIAKLKERADAMEQKNDDVTRTPKQYLRSINDAPGILGRCLEGLHAASGWTYMVVMGGPHPLSNGDIAVASYNVGPDAADFGKAYPNVQKTYMANFTEYLEKVYPEATRRERALTPLESDDLNDDLSLETDKHSPDGIRPKPVEKGTPQRSISTASTRIADPGPSNTTDDSATTNTETVIETTSLETGTSLLGEPQVPAAVDTQLTSTTSSNLLPTVPTRIADPGPSNTADDSATTTSLETRTSLLEELAGGFHFPDNQSTTYHKNTLPLGYNYPTMMGMESNSHDWGALDMDPQFPLFDTTGFGLQNGQSAQSSSTSTHHEFNLHFPPFDSQKFSFDAPSNGFEQFSGPSSRSNLNSLTDFPSIAPNNNPCFSVPCFSFPSVVPPALANASVNALPSNASSPTVVPDNAPQYIPATNNASPQPTTTPVSPAAVPTSNASLQPTTTPVSPATVPSDASPQHAAALSSDSDTLSVPLNQADSRRSGRNPVPSKRHEQMNEIDGGKAKNKTTASDPVEKENIPSTTPEWTVASHDHLLNSDLGNDWTACVQAWFELEQDLGYGSKPGAKGALPSTASRPQEWASWTSKSRSGVCNYQCIPLINDAAEFGIALQGWWNGIQPSFRKSDTGIPTSIYSCPTDQHRDAWVLLRKGGPNGLVSVLTLLFWWGQALAKQTDSSPDWRHMVLDVTKCLIAMKDSNGVSLKRKAAPCQEKEKKRARISS